MKTIKKSLLKTIFFISLLALAPFFFGSRANADATGCVAVEVRLYDANTNERIADPSVFVALKANVYEDGKFVRTVESPMEYGLFRLIIGYDSAMYGGFGTPINYGCKYDVELLLPADYELRYSTAYGLPSSAYTVTGNKLSFTFNYTVKKQADSLGDGLTFDLAYYNGPKPKLATEISLPKTSYNLAYGAKGFQINAKVVNGENPTYKSSDPSVITVSGAGLVTVKNPGKATVTVSSPSTGEFTGATKTIRFTVTPKKVASVKAVSTEAKQVTITWEKTPAVSGYEVLISRDKKFKTNTMRYQIKSTKTTSKTISKLKKGKVYYVKVRAYKTVSQSKIYGAYSRRKTVIVK